MPLRCFQDTLHAPSPHPQCFEKILGLGSGPKTAVPLNTSFKNQICKVVASKTFLGNVLEPSRAFGKRLKAPSSHLAPHFDFSTSVAPSLEAAERGVRGKQSEKSN